MANPDLLTSTAITQDILVDAALAVGANDWSIAAGRSWMIKSFALCNTAVGAVTIDAWVIPAGSTARKFLHQTQVASGDTLVVDTGLLSILSEAAILRISPDSVGVDLLVTGITTGGSSGGGSGGSGETSSGIPDDGSVTDVKVAVAAAINADKLANGTTNVIMTVDERSKLAGVAAGATANSADAALRDRGTHSGFQAISSVTGLQATLDGKADISAVPELARDALGTALIAGSNVTIIANDSNDTITIAATGTGGGSTSSDARRGYALGQTLGA